MKAYPRGIRENGGQYTHAAVWTAIAFAMQGNAERAMEVFNMLNPVTPNDDARRCAALQGGALRGGRRRVFRSPACRARRLDLVHGFSGLAVSRRPRMDPGVPRAREPPHARALRAGGMARLPFNIVITRHRITPYEIIVGQTARPSARCRCWWSTAMCRMPRTQYGRPASTTAPRHTVHMTWRACYSARGFSCHTGVVEQRRESSPTREYGANNHAASLRMRANATMVATMSASSTRMSANGQRAAMPAEEQPRPQRVQRRAAATNRPSALARTRTNRARARPARPPPPSPYIRVSRPARIRPPGGAHAGLGERGVELLARSTDAMAPMAPAIGAQRHPARERPATGFTGDGVTRKREAGVVHASRRTAPDSMRCATYSPAPPRQTILTA